MQEYNGIVDSLDSEGLSKHDIGVVNEAQGEQTQNLHHKLEQYTKLNSLYVS